MALQNTYGQADPNTAPPPGGVAQGNPFRGGGNQGWIQKIFPQLLKRMGGGGVPRRPTMGGGGQPGGNPGVDQGVRGFRDWTKQRPSGGTRLGGGGMPGGNMPQPTVAPTYGPPPDPWEDYGQGAPLISPGSGPRSPYDIPMPSFPPPGGGGLQPTLPQVPGRGAGGIATSPQMPGPYSDPYENMKAMRKGGANTFGAGWGG